MKIIGGVARGKKIFIPKGVYLRATTDRTKESLFNILPSIEGKSFLDLFAGTGNIGIEAMSRGAVRTVFVEQNPLMIKAIKKNLSLCGFERNYEIIKTTVEQGVGILSRRKDRYDIIFADPPYEKGYVGKILQLLSLASLNSEDGVIAIEHTVREEFEADIGKIALVDQRKYGETVISFFEMK